MLTIFLCGDVMLGRAVDQIFQFKTDPRLYETVNNDAKQYLPLKMLRYAKKNHYVGYDYIWGPLLKSPFYTNADLKIINLETSITHSQKPELKAVLYKMHPQNIETIKVANIDYCNMANNHVKDWGLDGLLETLNILKKNKINYGGIGKNLFEAQQPTCFHINNRKIFIFSIAEPGSGTPLEWKATHQNPGVNMIDIDDLTQILKFVDLIKKTTNNDDFIIVSIHWGSNWGWTIEDKYRNFAHHLIDYANVDLIHGHSSHHFRPIEMYKNKLIFYGCGDLINDYETINNPIHEQFKPHISLTYYPTYNNDKQIVKLIIIPFTIKNLQLTYLQPSEQTKVIDLLNKICQNYGLSFTPTPEEK